MNWPGSTNASPHSSVVGATPAGRSLQSKHAAMGVDEASSELRARREKRAQKCCNGEREVSPNIMSGCPELFSQCRKSCKRPHVTAAATATTTTAADRPTARATDRATERPGVRANERPSDPAATAAAAASKN